MDKKEIIPLLMIAAMFILAAYYYQQFPEKIPTHWNISGDVDGYSGKWTLFLFPAITLLMYLLLYFLPELDAFKANVEEFYKRFGFMMKFIFVLFFLTLYLATILQVKGVKFNITYFIFPSLAALFLFLGYTLRFIKRNYFIGVRTPWTLSSDKIWEKTHKLAGKLFIAAGIIMPFGLLFPKQLLWIFFALIITLLLAPVLYSLYLFKKK